MNSTQTAASPRFNSWPISIMTFFAVAIAGCATFIAFCSRNPADLISPNYYEEEVRYQGQMDRIQRAREQALSAAVTFEPATRSIHLSLPQVAGSERIVGQVQLYRPSAINLDRQVPLALDNRGNQRIDASQLLPGLWKVRVSWMGAGKEFYFDQKIVIPTVL